MRKSTGKTQSGRKGSVNGRRSRRDRATYRVVSGGTSGHKTIVARKVRQKWGVSQKMMSRLLCTSVRQISSIETSGKPPGHRTQKSLKEIDRLREGLEEVMKPDYIAEWLEIPNEGFAGLKPIEVIERGEIDRLWQMIFFLRSGVPA